MTLAQFQEMLETRIHQSGGVRKLAEELGCSPAYVSDCRKRRRDPGPKILKPLGLVRVVTIEYVKTNQTRGV